MTDLPGGVRPPSAERLTETQIREQLRERFRETASLLGQLARIRRPTPCVVCGAEFPGTRRAKYCSAACSSKAYRQRKKRQNQKEDER